MSTSGAAARRREPCTVGAIVVASLLAAAAPAAADEAAPPAGDTPGAAAMRAHVDPRTGRLAAEPPVAARAELPSAAHTTEGLVVTKAPGGGDMLDLEGRFQSRMVATVMPDGSVRLSHTDPAE